MSPMSIVYLVLLVLLLVGGVSPRFSSERSLIVAAAIIAVLFVLTMLGMMPR